MKVCSKCGNNHDGTSRYCPPCWNEYQKKYYKENPRSIIDSHRSRRQERRDYISSQKTGKPCTDCGIVYPWYVMDFDHVRGEKKFILAVAANRMSSHAAIDEEISKCDLVCANCHRVRTFTRLQLDDGVIGNTTDFESVR